MEAFSVVPARDYAGRKPSGTAASGPGSLSSRLPAEAWTSPLGVLPRGRLAEVFGLVGARPRAADLLPVPSQEKALPVEKTSFVPTYRCGAAPDFHRVPFRETRAIYAVIRRGARNDGTRVAFAATARSVRARASTRSGR